MSGLRTDPAGLAAIVIGGDGEPWRSIGFAGSRTIAFANGSIVLDTDAPAGIHGFSIHGDARRLGDRLVVDGVECGVVDHEPVEVADHPNGAFELDHVVLTTDSLERTCTAVDDVLGMPLKRVRDLGVARQGFHRFADEPWARGCIVEVVESPEHRDPGVATPWGLVVNLRDLERVAGAGHVGEARSAVQPGRRIATVSRSAGLGTALALMSH